MNPVIRQLADAEQVSRAAADEFTNLARQASGFTRRPADWFGS